MSIKSLFLLSTLLFLFGHLQSQVDSTKIKKSIQLESQLRIHKKAMDSLQKDLVLLKELMRDTTWQFGFEGILGVDFNRYSNWFANDLNESTAASISTILNFNAAIDKRRFYWNNSADINLSWNKLNIPGEQSAGFSKTSDIVILKTQYGLRFKKTPSDIINKKIFAASVLAELRSNLLSQSINATNLDFSMGVTWKPDRTFSALMHPLNYQVILTQTEVLESSVGGKVVLEYNRKNIVGAVDIKSSFTGIVSYENNEELSSYDWRTKIDYKILKNIGFAMEVGLRLKRQETNVIMADSALQNYIVFGVSYEFR